MNTIQSIKNILQNAPRLFRHFPYTEMFVAFIPFYAYLYKQGAIQSPKALLMLLPFVFSDAAGFTYNDLMDCKDSAGKNNPVALGRISPTETMGLVFVCLMLSISSFVIQFHNWKSWVVYFFYLFLCLAYSGLGIRFKETLLGPLVAAFIVWVGGLAILMLEFQKTDLFSICLLSGTFFFYLGREIYHTLIDYEEDLATGYKTFSVRLGLIQQLKFLGIACLLGATFLIFSFLSQGIFIINGAFSWLFVILLILSTGIISFYCISNKQFDLRIAFFLFRLALVVYVPIILNFSPLVIVLWLWVFLTSKRS